LAEKVRQALGFFPIVAVVGARQVGKSTLVQHEFPERKYFSLDFPEIRAIFEDDPYGFLISQKGPLTLDEVQKVPRVFEILKVLADKERQPGQFLITGSANFLLLQKVSETLAGRIGIFELSGFALCEAESYPPPPFLKDCLSSQEPPPPQESPSKPPLYELIMRGSFPPAVLAPQEFRRTWFQNYIATYLERDLRDLSQVASLGDFRRLMGLVALRTAQILNISELARDAGLAPSTTRNYFQLLEISYLVRRLRPYFSHLGKRLTKSPKIHFRDTGLAFVLSGINPQELRTHPYYDALVETFLTEEIIKLVSFFEPEAQFYYFRTHAGAEVDLVIEAHGRLLPIEIKNSAEISKRKIRGLTEFLKMFPEKAPWGLVVYQGQEFLKISPRIFLVPWTHII